MLYRVWLSCLGKNCTSAVALLCLVFAIQSHACMYTYIHAYISYIYEHTHGFVHMYAHTSVCMLISRCIYHVQGYPYTKDKVVQQARIDICPFFRAEVWAVLLGVKVSKKFHNVQMYMLYALVLMHMK